MGHDWGGLLRLLMLTGARRGEIALLRHGEINIAERMVTLNPDRIKNKEKRHIILSDNACELLTDFHTGDEPTGRYVFEKRSAFTSMKYRLDKLLPDITEYWRFHDFRTALASTLASRGMASSDLIDDLLGH